MAKIVPLFSGSKGNAYYVGSGGKGVLIDAGKSCRLIEKAMAINGINMESIKSVFITHEHVDHCSGLKVLTAKYGYRVFATSGTLGALLDADRISGNCIACTIQEEVVVSDILVKRIHTSHDSAESCCYSITLEDGRKAVVATDFGVMTETLRKEIKESHLVLIESNYDKNMLRNGRYPYLVKRRILSDKGHFSNESCAGELCEFIKHGSNRIVLGHLSRENNTPDLALQTSVCALHMDGMKKDIDYTIDIAPPEPLEMSIVF